MTTIQNRPTDALRHRRYRSLPDAKYLTPAIVKAAAEADRIAAELRTTQRRLADISTGAAAEDAKRVDQAAAIDAIRAGKPASLMGTPAGDALAEEQDALGPQIDALSMALAEAERDVSLGFYALVDKPKQNGQATLTTAQARYRDAITELCAARQQWAEADAIATYLRDAARIGNWTEPALRPVRLPVPPGLGMHPGNVPLMDFTDLIAAVTAEVAP